MTHGLRMSPDLMRELALQVTELLVERSTRLPADRAWDGEFKQELTARLMEEPPEIGRPPREVVDRAVRDILSPTLRLDHPRAFGFVPSAQTWPGVLADFLVSGFNMRAAGRLSQCRARRAGGADSRHTCKERATVLRACSRPTRSGTLSTVRRSLLYL